MKIVGQEVRAKRAVKVLKTKKP